MCGRFTNKLTWDDIVRLYRLTLNAPPHNLRPRYNVCPTDTIDTIVLEQDVRSLVPMRWGLGAIRRAGIVGSRIVGVWEKGVYGTASAIKSYAD